MAPDLFPGEWIVQEKIHGSNMSFETDDGKTVSVASRTQTLGNNSYKQFFNCGLLVDSVKPLVCALWNLIRDKDVSDGSLVVRVFGELCGGGYKGLPAIPMLSRIQKGVEYSNNHVFVAFDVRVNNHLVNCERALEYLKQVGFLASETLYRGSFDDCVAWSRAHNADDSLLAGILGNPPLKDNIREGNVIKPVQPRVLSSGETVMFKDKNETFCERAAAPKNRLVSHDATLLPYITSNRIEAVLSKHGSFAELCASDKYFPQKLASEVVKDAIADWQRDNPTIAVAPDAKSTAIKMATELVGKL
jgi:Rnl2 family RNA ligase